MNQPSFSRSGAFISLVQADMLVQWRHKIALSMSILFPIIILGLLKTAIDKGTMDAASALSVAIGFYVPIIGIMAYPQAVARDRDRGILQRLRATPVSTWSIMGSRIVVHLLIIALMALSAFAFGLLVNHASLNIPTLLLTFGVILLCGCAFIGFGQFIVGLLKSSAAVNAASRLLYLPLVIAVGLLGQFGFVGHILMNVFKWSPYGTTQMILQAAFHPAIWTTQVWIALAATIAYTIIFMVLGMKYFRWNVE